MNRDSLIRLLARAVADGTITEAQARELLSQFDAGTLDLSTLPLEPGELESNPNDELIAAAILIVLALLRRRMVDGALVVDIMQDRFEARVRTLAEQLAAGTITIADWQRAMNEAILRNLTEQTMAGSGVARLSPSQRQSIRDATRGQNAYLSRFADTVIVAGLIGAGMSVKAIASRAASYGGAGRSAYYRAQDATQEEGTVVYYISRDDGYTCGPCLDAEANSPYLAGTDHPYPASVCLGEGLCRCRLRYVYDPDLARRLRGNP